MIVLDITIQSLSPRLSPSGIMLMIPVTVTALVKFLGPVTRDMKLLMTRILLSGFIPGIDLEETPILPIWIGLGFLHYATIETLISTYNNHANIICKSPSPSGVGFLLLLPPRSVSGHQEAARHIPPIFFCLNTLPNRYRFLPLCISYVIHRAGGTVETVGF